MTAGSIASARIIRVGTGDCPPTAIQGSASTASPDSVAEHLGQPLPDTRLLISASHSWSGFTRHCHQTLSPLPGLTISGRRAPFFLLCHSRATSGLRTARDVWILARVRAHMGHPLPFTRSAITADQTWRGLTRQRHQTLLLLPALTASGVRWPFFSVCHS